MSRELRKEASEIKESIVAAINGIVKLASDLVTLYQLMQVCETIGCSEDVIESARRVVERVIRLVGESIERSAEEVHQVS